MLDWEEFEKKISMSLTKMLCLLEINIKEHYMMSEPFILSKKDEFNKLNLNKYDETSIEIKKNDNEKVLI